MNNQLSQNNQFQGYQLDAIWQQVLSCVFWCPGYYQKLFREYGDLITFDRTVACVRLRLFADSWLMRLNQQQLEKVITRAFRLADERPKALTSSFLLIDERATFQAKLENYFQKWRVEEEKRLKNLIAETAAQLETGLTKRKKPLTQRGINMKKRELESFNKALQNLDNRIKFSALKYSTLSDNFQVHLEVDEVQDYLPDQLLPFQYRSLDGLLPFPLPSVRFTEKSQLPKCPSVYFVLDGENITNSRVLYVGQAVNLKTRWQKHNRLKQLKSISGNLTIAWLECTKGEAVRSMIETAFINLVEPELNESQVDRTKKPKKIFLAILQELLAETATGLNILEMIDEEQSCIDNTSRL